MKLEYWFDGQIVIYWDTWDYPWVIEIQEEWRRFVLKHEA